MDTPAYAFAVFRKHYEAAGFASRSDFTVLELGPGDSLLTALFSRALGATHTWLVDVAPLAAQDISLFVEAEQMLSGLNLPVPGGATTPSAGAALEQLSASYLTEGLASLRTIPNGAVDLIFSQAVLEHVRLSDFTTIAKEMRRILKPDGMASHVIDFRDHLQNGLNNLRFSQRIWESEFMARSGFYTNRLTWPQMEKQFRDASFSVELRSSEIWPNGLPTLQSKMAFPFKSMRPEELMVMGAHVLLRPVC
jgi:SAM-dependent methyltransferase